MGKINFDVVLENLSENQLNRDFGEFFNISKFNDILFSVILNSEEKILNIDDDFDKVFNTEIIKEISQIENIEESSDFNFSLGLDSRPILYEDINLSFSSFFGKIYKNLDYKNVKEVIPKIPSINFNVLKNKVCLDFKKINEEFSSLFHNLIIGENDVNYSNRKKFFKTKSLSSKVNFNSDVEMILDNVSFDDINSSFNLIFGNISKQNKTVENFFHIEESKNLDVEFDYDFDKNDFLRLDEYFESFFEFSKSEIEVLEEPKPFYINFNIFKENFSLDFKTLNHEFSSYFPKFEKVKKLEDLIELKEVQASDYSFNYNLVEDLNKCDFSEINHDFNDTFCSDLIQFEKFTKDVQFENEFEEIDLSVKMICDNFEIEDINSSFNLIFGEVFRDERTKKVENFFHIEESKNLDVEFDYDFDKNDFLRLDEHFESFFEFSKSEIEVLEEPKPFYINFNIFKENFSLDFKTLNHEFSSYFPKPIDVVQNKNVKDLKDSVEIKEFHSSDLNFDLSPIEESFDKFEMNDDFEYFFDLDSNKVVKSNSVVKVLDIDLTRRRVNKESLETFKSDPLEFFVPEFSSKTKLKDEIVKEADQIIDDKIENVEEKYNDLLNSEINQIKQEHQKNIDLIKKENDKKLSNLSNEFNLFKKMMMEQMSNVKSTFLSATSGGGAINILDMNDVDKSNLQNGYTLSYNQSLRKFQFVDSGIAGSTSTLDLMDSFCFDVTQEDLDNGYYDLPHVADPNYYNLSEIIINGMQNNFPDQYTFISTSRIDISTLSLAVGDKVRILYIKS